MNAPWLNDGDVTVHAGDCTEVMATLDEASIDVVITDPPYGLEFMGREWDSIGRNVGPGGKRRERERLIEDRADGKWQPGSTYGAHAKNPRCQHCHRLRFDHTDRKCACAVPLFHARASEYGAAMQEWHIAWTSAAMRVLRPGGHLLAFGGTRTFHRLTCGLEDAGFEIRDVLTWLYGSGFPKSLDVSKAIDKAAGAEREPGRTLVTDGTRGATPNSPGNATCADCGRPARGVNYCTCPRDGGPVTDAAREWEGWGTALKPAWEPIILARKPLAGTVAHNVTEHGTGALNIDAARIHTDGRPHRENQGRDAVNCYGDGLAGSRAAGTTDLGRWPANVALDADAAALLDDQVGELTSGANPTRRGSDKFRTAYGDFTGQAECVAQRGKDVGGPSRFFYTGKASTADRNNGHGPANTHPTVKPTDLMRWLVRLATPPGGIILDPFAGSGTTGVAARAEGHRAVLIERDPEYLQIIAGRLSQQSLFATGG